MQNKSPVAKTNKNIILDLDETLLLTTVKSCKIKELGLLTDPNLVELRSRLYYLDLEDVTSIRGQGFRNIMWGIKRPYLDQFLTFCFQYFANVCVWTAGIDGYGHRICEEIFRGIGTPALIYTRSNTITERKIVVKPLTNMFNSPEGKRLGLREENTIILDDRQSAYLKNPNNGILIPAYSPECNVNSLQQEDHCLENFQNWLLTSNFAAVTDVRTYLSNPKNTENIFTNCKSSSNGGEKLSVNNDGPHPWLPDPSLLENVTKVPVQTPV